MAAVREELRKMVERYKEEISALVEARKEIEERVRVKERLLRECEKLYRPRRVPSRARRARVGKVTRGEAPTVAASKPFASMSITNATEQIIKAAGRPIHLKEITLKLIEGGRAIRSKKPEIVVRNTLVKDKRFKNVGRNTFTLLG